MTASRTSFLAPLLGFGLIGFTAPGFAPNAAADPEAAYCEALSAALPGIDATYQELKKTADAEAAASDAPADDDEDADDAQDSAAAKPKQLSDLDEATLLQKEIELADRLSGSLNDLAHQTQEDGLKRIAKEASDTAGSFSGSLHEKQDGDAPAVGPRSRPNEDAPDPAETPNIGMLSGLVHPNAAGNEGDDLYANLSYSSNKLRNELNALNHLCQAVNLDQQDGAVAPGGRRSGG